MICMIKYYKCHCAKGVSLEKQSIFINEQAKVPPAYAGWD